MGRRRRRLLRILLNTATVVSLVLCVATVVLWVLSYRVEPKVEGMRAKRIWQVSVTGGRVGVYHERNVGPNAAYREDEERPYGVRYAPRTSPVEPPPVLTAANGRDVDLNWGAFRMAVHDGSGEPWPSIVTLVMLPCWAVCATLLLPPAARALHWAASHRQRRRGRCPACGYDLRGTPDRCPECGTVAAPSA